MKKFLSIFIAVAMVLSFATMFAVAPTNAPVAKAATLTITDSPSAHLPYYNPVPGFGTQGTENDLGTTYVYKMGDTIHGMIDTTPTSTWTVELRDTAGNVIDSVTMAAGSNSFTIGTGNVAKDGEYNVVAVVNNADYASATVYIQYNLTWKSKTITTCDSSQTISGWITRGNGQTVLVPVDVYVAYPDNTLAGYYHVTPNSSGQFTITFPITPGDEAFIGDYNIYIRDGYDPANGDNDAMIYDTLSNIPATSLTLSTYRLYL